MRYRERTKFEGDSSRLRTAAAGRGDCGAGREEKSGSYVSPLRLSPRPPRPRGWRLLTRTASLESPGTQRALGLRAPRVLQMTGAALRRGGVVLVLALAALAAPLSVAQAQTVSSISFTSSPASGDTYTRGERIIIEVVFDGSVEVSNRHLLRLALRVGSVTEQVAPIGDSPRTLNFSYTVKQSDLDADGISVPANPLSLNGAAITVPGDPDTAVTLTHAGIADDATRKVDGSQVAAPTVQTILFQTTPLTGDTYRRGEIIRVSVTFDKAVRVTGEPQLALTIGTSVRNASRTSGSAPSESVQFGYTVEAGDVDPDGISIAANALSLNGGAIDLADGTIAADITHPAVAADPAHKVEGTLILPPTVTSVYVEFQPEDGLAYRLGEEIRARAAFDSAIEVTGRPQLALTIGTTTRQATYSRIWGTTFMEFFYTVQASDMDADGISISADALTLNGGAIRGADRAQNAVLTHAAADDDPEHKVDGGASFAPQVASVGLSLTPRSGETYVRGETIRMLVQFDRMAEVSGSPRVALTIGGNTRYATYHSVSTPRPFRLLFVYTVQASDMDADGISIPANAVDLNGGAITLPGEPEVAAVLTHVAVDNDATRKVDGSIAAAPTVTAVAFFGTPLIGTTYTAGETIGAYVQFDREVDVTGEPQLALTIGANTRQASFGRVWESNFHYILFSYIVQTSDMDADGINVPADALSLNGGTITLRGNATTDAVLTHVATTADAGRKVDGSSSAPEALSISFSNAPTGGDTYALSEEITADVQFTKALDVSGTPRLALTIGANTRQAEFQSILGSCKCTLRFSYSVQASDMDDDGIEIASDSLSLNGGTIKLAGASSVDAVLSHSAVNADATRKVDGTAVPWSVTVDPAAINEFGGVVSSTLTVSTGGATFAVDQRIKLEFSGTAVTSPGDDFQLFDADGVEIPSGGSIARSLLAGETELSFTITALADEVDEPDETLVIQAKHGVGTLLDPQVDIGEAVTVTIRNVPFPWSVTVDPETIDEDGGVAAVTVSTGGAAGFDMERTITLGVTGTAMENDDYTIGSKSLTLGVEETEVSTTITATPQSEIEGAETVTITAMIGTEQIGETVTLTIVEIEPPGAPDLTLLFACTGCVELAWNAPDSEGGGPITGYQYQRKEGDGGYGNWTDIEDDAVENKFVTYYDVDPDTTYTYRVRAVNAGGGGAASNERSVTTGPPIEVGVDLLEYRVAETAGSVTVKVVAKVPEDWEFYNREFQVTVATESRSAASFEDYKPITDTLTFVPSDFRNIDGQYTATKDVSIEIVDKPEAEEEESFVVLVEPAPGLASFILIPDATDTATVTIVDADHAPVIQLQKLNVVLDRTEVGRLRASDADGDELTWRIVGGADRDQFELTEDGLLSVKVARTSATLANPDDDDRDGFYEVVVEVTDGGNPVTATLSLELVDAEPPSTPLRPIVGPGDGEATAYWSAPASDGGAPIDRYEYWVHRSGRDSPLTGRTCPEEVLAQGERACALFLQSGELEDWTPVPGGAAARRVTVGNLVNGKLYQFKVRAVNAAGPGMYAWQPAEPYGEAGEPPELTVTLADQTVDDTVTTVAVARWTEPANPAGLPLVGYLFEGSRDGVEWANADGSYRSEKFFGRLIGSCSETYHSPCNRLAEFNNRRLVLEEHMTHWHFRVQALYSAGTLEVYADAPEEAKNKLRVSSPYSNVARAGDDDALPGTVAEALTVRFEDTPESHSGRAFGFRVAFNQAVAIDEASFAAHALIVGNGAVTAAARVEARPGAWEVTVAPASFAAVSVRLANPPCGEPGAVCTADGGTLEAAPAELIPGPPAGVVTAFELVDRGPGGETVTLSDGGTVELADPSALRWGIVATVADDDVKSVELKLRGPGPNEPVTKTENYAPWSLYGDANGKAHGKALPAGRYTLTATAYAEKNLGGAVLGALGIAFTVSAASGPAVVPDTEPAVTGFKLVDRVENTTVALADGMTVELADPSAQRWAIVAEVDSSAGVKSVTLALSGAKTVSPRTENVAPWSLYGDDLTDPYGKNLPAGAYRLTATAWSEKNLGGDDLGTLRIGFTAVGPPALSVADATANEADGRIAFEVTLSRKASRPVTVDWATANGSATAGEDYTGASGTLTFEPGDTSKTVEVALLDDAVDDGGETFTVSLSNASGAVIADGEAVGTIENSDPMPSAWTARFGRSVATHVLDAVEERLDGASQSYVRLGGHQLGGSQDVREAVQRLAPDRSVWEEAESADAVGQDVTVRQLLLGSAFHLVSNSEARARGPRLSAWGRVATSGFDGREDTLSLGGTVTTAILGVDGVWKRWLTGVALAYSEGDGSFTQVEAAGGDVASALTSVHPYVAFAPSDRVRLWGMVGYGSGSLQLKLAEQGALDTGLSLTMGAVGIRGRLLEPSQTQGGLQLALRSDVLWVQMDTAATAGMVATEAEVSRLRLVLEGSRPVVLAAGGSLVPSLEVGLRHDGGDAETGSGLEVGGRLGYTSAWGLSIEASVRGLLAHEAEDYQEWGASGAVRFDPGQQGRGLSASIVPTWGSAASGVSRLWGQPDASGLAVDNALATAAAGRLEAELGYGLAALRGQGLLTPYVRAALVEGDSQAWHLGARLAIASSLNVSLEASRRQQDGDAAAHELALRATLGW